MRWYLFDTSYSIDATDEFYCSYWIYQQSRGNAIGKKQVNLLTIDGRSRLLLHATLDRHGCGVAQRRHRVLVVLIVTAMKTFLVGTAQVFLGTVIFAAAYLLLTPRYLPDPIEWPPSGPFMAYELSRLVVGVSFGLMFMMGWLAIRAFLRRR